MQALLKCMLRCFWNVSSVLIVLLIFYYMFAISGMQLFADTKYGLELNAKSNFDNFGESMLTLLKVSTGEYVGLLRDCSVRAPDCITGSDCGSRFAWIYFSVFLIFTSYITFQLFLAVVIDSFAWAYSLEDSGQVCALPAALALPSSPPCRMIRRATGGAHYQRRSCRGIHHSILQI